MQLLDLEPSGPQPSRFTQMMHRMLDSLEVLPRNSPAATVYETMRAEKERQGIACGELDMLIAAHALAESAILVTNDVGLAKRSRTSRRP